MKVLTSCLMGSLLFLANQVSTADETINLAGCRGLTVEAFNKVAKYSLNRRKYEIQEDTGDRVTGKLKKSTVEVVMEGPEQIVIRWKGTPGKPRWLRNIKTDILWKLVE